MVVIKTIHGDCLDILKGMADDSVDATICSPPYEDARSYDISFRLKGQAWVDWCVERYVECVRVTKGLVVWVVEGRTRQFRWSATPALLMADLHRKGIKLRKPPIYHRVGIPGSGGPDWWRNDYEFCVCSSKGRLPWSANTAIGLPCKHPPGGAMSHRVKDGGRKGDANGKTKISRGLAGLPDGSKFHTKTDVHGVKKAQLYTPPEIANPGNVITCSVGGGRMGSDFAHENEAPFPVSLVEPFVRCFCPEGGTVLDPFCGSGTTLDVAKKWGRNAIGIDIRESQVELSNRRVVL